MPSSSPCSTGRRFDTSAVGDLGEHEAARLLQARGWTVANLNHERRNTPLHDLRAAKDGKQVMISVKHARAKRHIRLGRPTMFRKLRDEDVIMIFLPTALGRQTDIARGDYELWIVPGDARHQALAAHLHYYGGDEAVAFSQSSMMIKDKLDKPGSRSVSGAVFHAWRTAFKDNWAIFG